MRKAWMTAAILAAAVWLLVPCSARAEDPRPFSGKELDKLLSDLPGFVSFMNAEEKTIGDAGDPTVWQSLQLSRRMLEYLEKRGWKPERFFYVVSHVSVGLAAVTMEENAPRVQAQLAESQKAIQENPMISPEMKRQLLDQMQQGAEQTRQMDRVGQDLPAEELALIRKNKARIVETFETAE